MYEDFIRQRIEEFRNKANVSEYQLSLNLGRSKGYIQSISSGRSIVVQLSRHKFNLFIMNRYM